MLLNKGLKLNKHPFVDDDGDIVYAKNVRFNNNNVLMTEESIGNIDIVSKTLTECYPNGYEIIYCVSTNIEIVLFVKYNDEFINTALWRYNNGNFFNTNKTIDYHGGKITSSYNYVNNELYITYSEYDNDIEYNELRYIDFNDFRKETTYINPHIKIPNCEHFFVNNKSYKGHYYLYIRYKLGYKDYTKWYPINYHHINDAYNSNTIIDYYYYTGDRQYDIEKQHFELTDYISEDTDLCNIAPKYILNDLDENFNSYQLGIIISAKSYTKYFRSKDINIHINEVIFNNTFIEEQFNYNIAYFYNVKTIDFYKDRQYIGNYIERKPINISEIKQIAVNLKFVDKNNLSNINKIRKAAKANNSSYLKIEHPDYPEYYIIRPSYLDSDSKRYVYVYDSNIAITELTMIGIYASAKYTYVVYDDSRIGKEYKLYYSTNKDVFADHKFIDFNATIIYYIDDKKFKIINNDSGEEILANHVGFYPGDSPNSNNNVKSVTSYYINNTTNKSYTSNSSSHPFVLYRMVYENYSNTQPDNPDDPNTNPNDSEQNINETKEKDIITNVKYPTFKPDTYYKFYIHFVAADGYITDGYNITNFKLKLENCETYKDLILIKTPKGINYNHYSKVNDILKIYGSISISNFPKGYVGYFISHEKYEDLFPIGFIYNKGKLYNTELDYINSLSSNYNYIDVIYNNGNTDLNKTVDFNVKINKANSINNIGNSTSINFSIIDPSINVILLRKDKDNLYNNEIKELIPCSCISYTLNNIMRGNCYNTNIKALIFDNVYYDETIKAYKNFGQTDIIKTPCTIKKFNIIKEIPTEFEYINAKQTVFTLDITPQNRDTAKQFVASSIITPANSIDFYNNPHTLDIINAYQNNDYNNIYITNFPKTIRRSNLSKDESYVNLLKYFDLEDYTNITENHGEIIKITASGYLMFVHTISNIFIFNISEGIKSNENNLIQLANIDIWDIKYKELISDLNANFGIKHENDVSLGEYGYLFYNHDNKCIYSYNNNKFNIVSENIEYLLKEIPDDYELIITNDFPRKRLIFNFKNYIRISYNYKFEKWVSIHDYDYNFSAITNKNVYLIDKEAQNIAEYKNIFNNYNFNTDVKESIINVIFNTKYENIKYIEYLKYKLNKINNITNIDNVINAKEIYSGDILRIFTEFCDTGNMDIKVENEINDLNNILDYNKPYFRLGNWHFNYIRNVTDIKERNRIYGNWFVISFIFNRDKLIQLESINCKFVNDITN